MADIPTALDASPFEGAAKAAHGYAEVGQSILANNPGLQRIQGFIEAKKLAQAQQGLDIQKQQADQQGKQIDASIQLGQGTLAETINKDKMDNQYQKDMLGYQQKSLDDQITQHANQYSIDLAKNSLEQRGQDLQKSIADQTAKIELAKTDVEKATLQQSIAFQTQQLKDNSRQLDITTQEANNNTLKTNWDIQFQQYKLSLLQKGGDMTEEQMNDRLKNEGDIIKDAQTKAQAAAAILPYIAQFNDSLSKVPETGPYIGAARQAMANLAAPFDGGTTATAYENLNSSADAMIKFLKTETPGKLSDNLLDLLKSETGGAGVTKETNETLVNLVNTKVAFMTQYPTFMSKWQTTFGNLNDATQGWTDYTSLYAVKNGKANIPGDRDYQSFIQNYGIYQQEAAKTGLSTLNYLQAVTGGR